MTRGLVGLLFLLAACEPPVEGSAAAVQVFGCDLPEACGVTGSQCQSAWLEMSACLRASEPVSVPVRLVDENTLDAELAALPSEPRPDPDHWETALTLLGFVAPGAYQAPVEKSAASIDGYYAPGTQDITIVDHGAYRDLASENATLLRELVHAAQDQEFGIDPFIGLATTSDASLGARSLLEGEAELYATLVLYALVGAAPSEAQLATNFDTRITIVLRQLFENAFPESSPYLIAFETLPQAFGERYVYQVRGAAGPRAIRDLFAPAAVPPSLRRLWLGDLSGELDQPEPVFLDVGSLSEGSFELVSSDSFGALGIYLYIGSEQHDLAVSLVDPLQGDRVNVLSGAGETALVWQVTFDDPDSASAFLEAAEQSPFYGPSQGWFDLGEGQLVLVAATTEQTELDLIELLGL